jgi:membrane protease YdiL (CAAX protease family)
MSDTAAAADTPRWVGPRLKFLPIVLVLVVGWVALQLAFLAVHLITHSTTPPMHWPQWLMLIVAEAFELILALVGIVIAKRLLRDSDFGLRWPPGRTYLGWAIFWGTAFGFIMLVADHWPALIHLRAPDVPEAATPVNIAGWLGFELFWVGICEETLFRGLLLGVLMALSPSKIRIGGTQFSTAGITIALLFALAHAGNFAVRPWYEALAQQIYAVALGIIYAWLRERSGSLAPAIVAHSLSDFVETGLEYLLAGTLT